MKIKHLLVSLLASAALFAGCQDEEKDLGLPEVKITQNELSFDQNVGTSAVTVYATRDWTVSTSADWLAFTPSKGKAYKETAVTVTALANEGYNRTAAVKFDIGYDYKTLTVTQEGPLGEKTEGSGTLEDPYTVKGVLAYIQSLGVDESPEVVYVSGKVATITESYTAQYGNATFTINDSGTEGEAVFTAYRVKYLGNKAWTANDSQIEVGDEVIVAGKVYNYGGKTPETVSNTGYLYSHNGKTAGGTIDEPIGEDVVYFNNFDKEAATQTYGNSGNSWPFLDQFEGWKNETGSGAEGVSYLFKALSVRANSPSSGSYSDYSGSGSNNLFYGADGYFAVKNIALPEGSTSFTLSFGSERYLFGATDNTFNHSEFLVYISADGAKWVQIEYAFPNGDKSGRWDKASSTFTLPEATTSLSICAKATIASAYRLDDLRLDVSTSTGTAIDFTNGIDLGLGSPEEPITWDKIKFNKVTSVTSGKGYIIVADGKLAKNLASDKTYGYLSVEDVTDNDGLIELGSDANIFIFENTDNGWTIRQKDGRYLYMTENYNNFNLDAAPTEAQYWTVAAENDAFKITNIARDKYIQYSSQHTSYGSYNTESGSLPALYEMEGNPTVTEPVTPEPGEPIEGETKTITLAATDFTADTDATYGTGFKYETDGYTIAYYKHTSTTNPVNTHTDHIRVYKNSVIVITAPEGVTMKALTFNCTYPDNTYAMNVLEGGGTTTADTSAKTVKWTGSASKFIGHTVNGQCRIASIDIIYE